MAPHKLYDLKRNTGWLLVYYNILSISNSMFILIYRNLIQYKLYFCSKLIYDMSLVNIEMDITMGNERTPEERFKVLAEQRMTQALKFIRLIGNLSNRQSYDYSPEQYKRMISELKKRVLEAEARFKEAKDQKIEDSFKWE